MKQVSYIKKVNIYRNEMPLWLTTLLKAIFITFIICCFFVALFSFLYSYTPVEGKSMYPTLNSNIYNEYGLQVEGYADSVYINRFAGYKRGDIVVFKDPDPNRSTGIYVVKRLIAMEGDKIAIGTNYESEYENVYKIFLIENGSSSIKILEENYLPTGTSLYETSKDFESYRLANPSKFSAEISPVYGTLYFLTLSENEAFILGDNRSAGSSNDSADYGAVSSTKYIGRVDIIAYESQNNFGYIFLYYWRKIFG